jgi:hypothetical protein
VPAQPNGEPPETEDSLYELDPVPVTIKGEVEDVPAASAEAEAGPAATAGAAAEAQDVPAAAADGTETASDAEFLTGHTV